MAKSSSSPPLTGKGVSDYLSDTPFSPSLLLLSGRSICNCAFSGDRDGAADVIPGYLPPTTVRVGKEKVFARCEVASAGNAIGVSAGLFVAQRDENLQGQQVDSNGIRDDEPGATGLQKCSRGMQEELSVSSSRFRVIVDN